MRLRLAQFLERCFYAAQHAPKPAYAMRDAWMRILNTEDVNLHDRELLELAAKAAGMKIVGNADNLVVYAGHHSGGFVIRNNKGGDSLWNPLTDDGDALRLAVMLRLCIDNCVGEYGDRKDVSVGEEGGIGPTAGVWAAEDRGPFPCAATRLAIVRVAAEIGRSRT